MSSIPFDQREGVIWLDGEFVEWSRAQLHVLTHGLHYASTVYEGERVYTAGSSSCASTASGCTARRT